VLDSLSIFKGGRVPGLAGEDAQGEVREWECRGGGGKREGRELAGGRGWGMLAVLSVSVGGE